MWFVHTGKMTNQRKLKTVSMQTQFVTDIFIYCRFVSAFYRTLLKHLLKPFRMGLKCV